MTKHASGSINAGASTRSKHSMSRSAQPEMQGPRRIPQVGRSDALLLRALLSQPPQAEEAWNQWTEALARSSWLDALSPYKRLWPLILRAVVRGRWQVPPS